MTISVVTDSTSDLSPEVLQKYGIVSVPLYVNFDGQMYQDGVDITLSDIYTGLRSGKHIPSTSQPSPVEFGKIYRQVVKNSTEVISVHISGQLSGTVGSARLAGQDPDFGRRITVIDSHSVSLGLGMQAIRAAEMAQAGHSVPDIEAALKRAAHLSDIRFTVDSLDFLKANGRIGGGSAFLGSLLNIKPILQIKHGKVEAASRVRGHKKALLDIVEHTRKYIASHGRTRIAYVSTPGGEQYTDELRSALASENLEDLGNFQFGSVVGIHTGPGTVGVTLEPVTV